MKRSATEETLGYLIKSQQTICYRKQGNYEKDNPVYHLSKRKKKQKRKMNPIDQTTKGEQCMQVRLYLLKQGFIIDLGE